MTAPGLPPHALLPYGPRADVDRVLQHARHRAVVFGRDEQHCVGGRESLLEFGHRRRAGPPRSPGCRAAAGRSRGSRARAAQAPSRSARSAILRLNDSLRRLPTKTATLRVVLMGFLSAGLGAGFLPVAGASLGQDNVSVRHACQRPPTPAFCRTIHRNGIIAPRRGVAQPGSALALGARCRRFESSHPDQNSEEIQLRATRD